MVTTGETEPSTITLSRDNQLVDVLLSIDARQPRGTA
jgi:hypothetical protein